ncbi:hypothetical protein [Streptomyces sp. NPDC001480]|uniref:hypothetical protein n=1 Tax=Streptomyces sp. NPDC001480 TaxID=3364577 RepID=UPI00367EDFDA
MSNHPRPAQGPAADDGRSDFLAIVVTGWLLITLGHVSPEAAAELAALLLAAWRTAIHRRPRG